MRSTLAILILVAVSGICYAKNCRHAADCPDGSFCLSPSGLCGGEGHCAFIPQACGPEITYVCGCDGKSYPNSCFAFARNVSIFDDEGCADVQVCSANKDCPAVADGTPQYCQYPNGQCSGRGRCADMPDICTAEVREVCGCDGKTYFNDCNAAQSGVNVKSRNRCNIPACHQSSECTQPNTYCYKPEGHCDGAGECVAYPLTCSNEFAPVCGCDGRYYGNSCYAATDGSSVRKQGQC